MIEIFAGRIGGGKTYEAVRRIAEWLAEGLTVCTNIELRWDGLAAYALDEFGVHVEPRQWIDLRGQSLAQFHSLTPEGEEGAPVKVVLDEAQLEFNTRDTMKADRGMMDFLTQSRKQYTDLLVITQAELNIDVQFRRLVHSIWRFKDLRKWRIPMLGVSLSHFVQVVTFGIFSGEIVLQCQYEPDGKTQQRQLWHTLDKRVFAAYNTTALLSTIKRSGKASKISLMKDHKKRGAALLRATMAVVGIGLFIWFYFLRPSPKDQKPAKPEPVAKVAPAPAVASPPAAPMPVEPAPVSAVSTAHFRENPSAAYLRADEQAARAEYEIFAENFRAYGADGNQRYLRTDSAEYHKGAMSKRGFVVQVSDRAAYILQPNGRMAWVVAEDIAATSQIQGGIKPEPKQAALN